jgi:hypothetical protein
MAVTRFSNSFLVAGLVGASVLAIAGCASSPAGTATSARPGSGGSGTGEHTNAVAGPFRLGAVNPFVLSGYDDRLWVADYGGTETLVVDPAALPGA